MRRGVVEMRRRSEHREFIVGVGGVCGRAGSWTATKTTWFGPLASSGDQPADTISRATLWANSIRRGIVRIRKREEYQYVFVGGMIIFHVVKQIRADRTRLVGITFIMRHDSMIKTAILYTM